MRGVYIPLPLEVQKALISLAEKELRDPRYQAAVLIRQELTRRGLLPADVQQPTADSLPPISTALDNHPIEPAPATAPALA